MQPQCLVEANDNLIANQVPRSTSGRQFNSAKTLLCKPFATCPKKVDVSISLSSCQTYIHPIRISCGNHRLYKSKSLIFKAREVSQLQITTFDTRIKGGDHAGRLRSSNKIWLWQKGKQHPWRARKLVPNENLETLKIPQDPQMLPCHRHSFYTLLPKSKISSTQNINTIITASHTYVYTHACVQRECIISKTHK
ncbi:hypothetical protein Droror1_Dr00024022 [Drosera rotundifolia]